LRRFLLVLALVLLAAYGLTGVVQVRQGELAVVRRFGRVLEEKAQPGLHVGLPWGMDRVDRVVVDRVQSVTVGFREDGAEEPLPPGQFLTGDHNLVNAQVVLYYKVRPEEVADYVVQSDRVDGALTRATESAMAEWVAGRTVDDVLLNGKQAMRGDLVRRVRERIEPYRLGVEVLDARLALVSPPREVKDAFDDVARAQTKIETQRNEAEQRAESQLRTAESEVFRIGQNAAAYAHNKRLLARQDAERFLERLRQYEAGRRTNPHYLRQIWEEERGKLFARLKANNQLDLLDHHLGAEGLDLFTAPRLPKKD
jgi:modulator of FtsH protease HflK